MKMSKTGVFDGRTRRVLLLMAVLTVAFAAAVAVMDHLTERLAHISPDYGPVDLKAVLFQGEVRAAAARLELETAGESGQGTAGRYLFTEEEYRLLYCQTGLGRPAVDAVLKQADGEEEIGDIQDTFFAEPKYICIRENWVALREQTVDDNGNVIRTTELRGLEDGDIILTKSSHVLGWRNGHAALVVDAKNQKTIEAIVIGQNTGIRRFKKWEKYPNVLVLRLAGAGREERARVAAWARENMMDIPYRLTVGFFGTKGEVRDSLSVSERTTVGGAGAETAENGELREVKKEAAQIPGTQCAHLIWRAYAEFGYDLDSNGGWIVTPKQLANSPLLEVVQVYGMNPGDPWP